MFLSAHEYYQWLTSSMFLNCPDKRGCNTLVRLVRVEPPSLGKPSEYIPIEIQTDTGLIFYFHPSTSDVPCIDEVHPDFSPLLFISDMNGNLTWNTTREIKRRQEQRITEQEKELASN